MLKTQGNNKKITDIINDLNKELGKSIYVGDSPEIEYIPFDSMSLNWATWGGFAYGRSHEVVGNESSGKTTLAIAVLKQVQKIEKKRYTSTKKRLEKELAKAKTKTEKARLSTELEELVERSSVILDIEHTIDPRWLIKNGVDVDKVLIFKVPPTSIEPNLDRLLQIIETGAIAYVVIDSIGAMISDAENKADLTKGNFGGVSKALGNFYKKVVPLLSTKHICLVAVNHTRDHMKGLPILVRPGGQMNKFVQSIVLWLKPGQAYKENYALASGTDVHILAKETNVRVAKNKLDGLSRQNGKFTIRVGVGVDYVYDLLTTAEAYGHVIRNSSWYSFFDPKTGEEVGKAQGAGRAVEWLTNNKAYYDKLWDHLYEECRKDDRGEIVLTNNFDEDGDDIDNLEVVDTDGAKVVPVEVPEE